MLRPPPRPVASSPPRGLPALLCLAFTLAPPAVAAAGTLYLQPLGAELPEAEVALVERALVELYAMPVARLPRVALPRAAYYPPRHRYRAEKLLDFLASRLPADGERVLGLTAVDISTTKGTAYDWGVLGLGGVGGTSCVISSYRARRRAASPRQARERLAKVAVHEIGHTLGLPHCPEPGCLMEDARGLVKTCDHEYDLCARCRAALAARGRTLPAAPRIPWRKPE